MNNADIVGIVCIALGLLLILAALYASPWFLVVSGVVVAVGVVMIITGGSSCRSMYDDDTGAERGAEEPKGTFVKIKEEKRPSGALEPPLTRVAV